MSQGLWDSHEAIFMLALLKGLFNEATQFDEEKLLRWLGRSPWAFGLAILLAQLLSPGVAWTINKSQLLSINICQIFIFKGFAASEAQNEIEIILLSISNKTKEGNWTILANLVLVMLFKGPSRLAETYLLATCRLETDSRRKYSTSHVQKLLSTSIAQQQLRTS